MTVEAPAKVNLTLEVFAERSDGYHALRSVVLPVSLADALEVEAADDGVIASDTGYADDLCVKAAKVLRAASGNGRLGARIAVTKRIPAGGGLGGGSADAAATLVALDRLWGLSLGRVRLAALAAEVGSDVPALVTGGPVVMEGRGELVTPVKGMAGGLSLVIAHPEVFCSTAEVYRRCVARAAGGPSPTDAMVAALASGDRRGLVAALANDLQAPAVSLHPEIAAALDALREAGAEAAMMSGSGSCVFGLAADDADASRIAGRLVSGGLSAWPVSALTKSVV